MFVVLVFSLVIFVLFLTQPASAATMPGTTTAFGSQVGGRSVINYAYTDFPWRLVAYDVYQFFRLAWALPYVLFPLSPADSGDLDELSWNVRNLFCIAVHVVLCFLQLLFIVSIPLLMLLPVWAFVVGVAAFLGLNYTLCLLLNGTGNTVEYRSDEEYAPELPEHAHERWFFLNGVAGG